MAAPILFLDIAGVLHASIGACKGVMYLAPDLDQALGGHEVRILSNRFASRPGAPSGPVHPQGSRPGKSYPGA